jgi:anti-sigma regulatory factor (Ser/Thr protein kinase)
VLTKVQLRRASGGSAVCRSHTTELEPEPAAASMARRWLARQLIAGYTEPDGVLDDAELIVSELVTNAVQAGATQLGLDIELHRDTVTIRVSDDVADLPRPRHSAVGDVGGRGLAIVAELARTWGTATIEPDSAGRTDPVARGKTVWAELTVPGAVAAAFRCER